MCVFWCRGEITGPNKAGSGSDIQGHAYKCKLSGYGDIKCVGFVQAIVMAVRRGLGFRKKDST